GLLPHSIAAPRTFPSRLSSPLGTFPLTTSVRDSLRHVVSSRRVFSFAILPLFYCVMKNLVLRWCWLSLAMLVMGTGPSASEVETSSSSRADSNALNLHEA